MNKAKIKGGQGHTDGATEDAGFICAMCVLALVAFGAACLFGCGAPAVHSPAPVLRKTFGGML